MKFIMLLALVACHKKDALSPTAVQTSEPEPVKPFTNTELAAITALSPRDPEPNCTEIGKTLSDPVGSFAHIAERVPMPPWVGIRACACLVDHAAEPAAEATLSRWVTSEAWAGLALTAINLLDKMPEDVAARIAAAALDGPIADRAHADIAASSHEKVRALVHE